MMKNNLFECAVTRVENFLDRSMNSNEIEIWKKKTNEWIKKKKRKVKKNKRIYIYIYAKRPRIDLSFRTVLACMTSTTFPGSPSLLSRSPLACISIITLAGIIHVQGSRKATDEGTSEIIGGMKRRNAWFNTLLTVSRGGELCTRYPLDRSLAIDQFSSRLKFLVWGEFTLSDCWSIKLIDLADTKSSVWMKFQSRQDKFDCSIDGSLLRREKGGIFCFSNLVV